MSKFQVLTKLWQKTLFFANLKDTVVAVDEVHVVILWRDIVFPTRYMYFLKFKMYFFQKWLI